MFARFRYWVQTSRSSLILVFSIFVLLISILIIFVERSENSKDFLTIGDSLWWAIVTLSTTGYGDKIPISFAGKIIASILIFVGIVSTSLFSGIFASMLIERRSTIRRGLVNLPALTDHLVICGWREDDMPIILENILKNDSSIRPYQLVIVSSVKPNTFQEMQQTHPALKKIHFIRGNCYSESVLQRANLAHAKKVLVFGDTDEQKTSLELDSQVVMTVLAIRGISNQVHIVAELNDTTYRQHLKNNADEIIFPREFSRSILSSTITTNGLGNILFSFLEGRKGTNIVTASIPEKFIGKSYAEFSEADDSRSFRLLIGILEHAGNPRMMKLHALREAQKTANTSELVENLLRVRNITAQTPVILPENDYIIKYNSLAIYLEKPASARMVP